MYKLKVKPEITPFYTLESITDTRKRFAHTIDTGITKQTL